MSGPVNDRDRPTLHVLAGPNGAGKTTLYETVLKDRLPGVEFVNADLLAWAEFGHPAATLAESQRGQQLADDRRSALMAQGKSLVTESTFSHPSKLDLLQEAREKGYELRVYHVNVRSPEVSVLRVQSRVESGGHPVPEDKIRERYVRNQALIREAVRIADRAFVFDNSKLGEPHRLAMSFRQGDVVRLNDPVPNWARQLYAEDLSRFTPQRVNAPAASYEAAAALTRQLLGEGARTFIARPEGRYAGEIIGITQMHVVQKLSGRAAVAHFADRLPRQLDLKERLVVQYPADRAGSAVLEPFRQARESATQQQSLPLAPVGDKSSAASSVDPVARLQSLGQRLQAMEGEAMASMLEALRAGQKDAVQKLLQDKPQLRLMVRDLMKELGAEPTGRNSQAGQDEVQRRKTEDKDR